MKKLLVVAHTPSENTRKLLDAVLEGTRHPSICDVTVKEVAPLHAIAQDVLDCDAIILGTTENLVKVVPCPACVVTGETAIDHIEATCCLRNW